MLGALAIMGASAAAKSGLDWVKGKIDNAAYADRIRDQADLQYAFAERYAKNSPSWNIEGLRRAGLNPVLAVSNGVNLGANVPNLSASSPSTDSGKSPDFLSAINLAKQNDLLDAEIEGQRIRNENEKANRGLDGKWGAISRLISESEKFSPQLTSFLQHSPILTVEKKAKHNLESYTDDERKALKLYEILQSLGYNDVDARHEGGEKFWDYLESAWAKDRRNVRSSRSR